VGIIESDFSHEELIRAHGKTYRSRQLSHDQGYHTRSILEYHTPGMAETRLLSIIFIDPKQLREETFLETSMYVQSRWQLTYIIRSSSASCFRLKYLWLLPTDSKRQENSMRLSQMGSQLWSPHPCEPRISFSLLSPMMDRHPTSGEFLTKYLSVDEAD
jgi:hypothetical protein